MSATNQSDKVFAIADSVCNCVQEMQDALEPHGMYIVLELLCKKNGGRRLSAPSLRVAKHDSKTKTRLPLIFCTHCPLCGKKYE